ncbi:MAG TPA: hypothetical protein VGB09_03390 [Candidatus Binatia bacterium]|jgi:ElaB/YqjD/DUF883 family membrane-anchored ribosome-binding protein
MEQNDNENIQEGRSEAARKAERAAERASAAAHRTAEKVGEQMRHFAGKIRDTGPKVESKIHDTAERLAEKFERGGEYFKEGHYRDTTQKVTQYIRRHPMTAMMVGVAAGLLLAIKRRH